jgi:uncharacterized protein YndB with AHSA1/START domain
MPSLSSSAPAEDLLPAETVEPVRKRVEVRAEPGKAFRVFTEEMDSWWPRTHHIGKSPMKRVNVESHNGGRIYTDQEDGTVCQWGTVLAWEPPSRFVMAWQITPEWQFEPDLQRCSEVEVRFTPIPNGGTLVELEHRGLQRHGAGCVHMRKSVDSEGGWGALMRMFAEKVDADS